MSLLARFIHRFKDTSQAPNAVLERWVASDGGGKLRYASATNTWTFSIRGVDILSSVMGLPDYGQETTVRLGYNLTSGVSLLRIGLNGAFQCNSDSNANVSGVASGSPLAAPSSFWLGSDEFGANNWTAVWSDKLYRLVDDTFAPEGMIIGDSINSWTNIVDLGGVNKMTPNVLPAAFIYTLSQSRARAGIVSLAHPGDIINQQKSALDASPYRLLTSIKWIYIQLGVNDLLQGHTSAQMITDLNTLVSTVRGYFPTAKILIGRMTPTGSVTANWSAVNLAIDGGGGTPVNGVDIRISANSSNLDSGTNTPAAGLYQDSIHPNTIGRRDYMMPPVAAALTSAGLLS